MSAILPRVELRRLLDKLRVMRLDEDEARILIRSHGAVCDLLDRLYNGRHNVSIPGYTAVDVPDHLMAEWETMVEESR